MQKFDFTDKIAANLMMYLVSDLSTHIVGQEFVIDGGSILI